MSGDEYGLFSESIHDDKDGIKAKGWWEILNEVHGN